MSSTIAAVVEVILRSRPLSARNVESILLLEFSLLCFMEYSLYVIFFHDQYFAKELQGNAFCSAEYLAHVC